MVLNQKIYWFKVLFLCFISSSFAQKRPNILWLTCEDISPLLGCYGDKNANTPNLDMLASEGIRYTNAFANAPVCAPARSTLITGMYASTNGTHNMRSQFLFNEDFKTYPELLREAGYYCTNNHKMDYNASNLGKEIWDESSKNAHYKNRKPGQPFFAVFNIYTTHESRIHEYDTSELFHNPDSMILPAYHPNLPEIKQDWAKLYDNISKMDGEIHEFLKELDELGLTDSTIVFFYSDHGGVVPGSKRFIKDAGTRVPLIIRLPDTYKHIAPVKANSVNDQMVSFVDFAPTLLSLAGIKVPENMQGSPFLGVYKEKPKEFTFFFRGRMDERIDLSYGICDNQYRLLYNFYPEKPRGQHLEYLWRARTADAWQEAYKNNKCNTAQEAFWKSKPVIELYDMKADPSEVNNLAENPKYEKTKNQLYKALYKTVLINRDAALIPETFLKVINEKSSIYEYTHSDAYPAELITQLAFASAKPSKKEEKLFRENIKHENPVVRYWSLKALSRMMLTESEIEKVVVPLLSDTSVTVKLLAAEIILQSNISDKAISTYRHLLQSNEEEILIATLNSLGFGGESVMNEFKGELGQILKTTKNQNVKNLLE